MTQAKLNAIVDLLLPTEKFLKFNYVLKQKSIKCKTIDLYKEYVQYMKENQPEYKCDKLNEFTQHMKDLNFTFRNIGGYNSYRITYEALKELADKKNWLHILDNDLAELNKNNDEDNDEDNEDYDNGISKKICQ